MKNNNLPVKQGLYDPVYEHDACGIGFVADIKGRKSHQIITQALEVLLNLDHRGGIGSEENTGDGAGILIQISDDYFRQICEDKNIILPKAGQYGIGMVFLPVDDDCRRRCEEQFESIVEEEGQEFICWRTVPVNNSSLGSAAVSCQPIIRQAFIARGSGTQKGKEFERKLYIIRKRAEKEIKPHSNGNYSNIYFASLSHKTIVYKGMLKAAQLPEFYPELLDERMKSAIALVHSRFSTNTFPSWERAHPNRYIVHNGEINTLRGNVNWMRARQAMFSTDLFNKDLDKILPVIDENGSDSAMMDNCLEFLYHSGYSLPHAMMMMIPEPWSGHESMDDQKKAFYQYHSCLMEPWDGPAAIAFTDGDQVGAVLDRNGLRPSRYYITMDGLVILASEVGVLDINPQNVIKKGRLQPGKMFLVDTVKGYIIEDEEIKRKITESRPYREWLDQYMTGIEDLDGCIEQENSESKDLVTKQRLFGYTYEDLSIILEPMAAKGEEPIGSMGNDTPLAVLSPKPQLLYNYFKQLFAQVTNPPIDAIRETIVMSTETLIGSECNLLEPVPEACMRIRMDTPILNNKEMSLLENIKQEGFKSELLQILYKVGDGGQGLEKAMEALCQKAEQAIINGANILILSDRRADREHGPIPALLAVSGLHHYLIGKGLRTRTSIVLSSAEPREVHHFALLIGYGADAVNPYLAYESIRDMIDRGLLKDIEYPSAEKNYIKAVVKGIVKVISKMGISTIQSYRGAQIFEAVGISHDVIQKYFVGTPSRIEGMDINKIAHEVELRHKAAFNAADRGDKVLDAGGLYKWRREGEQHLYNPETIHKLQQACRTGNYEMYKEYAEAINGRPEQVFTIRGLMKFKKINKPVPIDEVEPVESIVRRFKTGAMSYGSISKEAHEALAIAMNRLGGMSNTGEGGEDPDRFKPEPNGDSRCSAIKQVASGRFGVTSEYLINARELQIKIAQGAKPGEGGQLPGAKVYPWIARVRHSTPGVSLISPPPHHDIYSIEDLAELIYDLKNANSNARVSVKLVSEAGVGTVAAGVAKAGANVVVISGYDGGTGASPRTSIIHAGLPWELGVAETHQTLLLNNLRSRIVVETDGKLMTGRDVVIAALLGAEEFAFATAPLVVLGCVMMRVCHMDTCPVGIATQNPELRKNFSGDPQYVVNLMNFIAQDVREIMAELGFRNIDEMVGRTDVLALNEEKLNWKTEGLNLHSILYQPDVPQEVGRYCSTVRKAQLEKTLDRKILLQLCKPALEHGEKVRAKLPIRNTDRVAGTILGSEITRIYGAKGLPEDTIHLYFRGSAGQSFGAFIPKGVTLELEGDANDYIGKGLSGGKIIVYPPKNAIFIPEENITIGNVAFYGATGGEAYIRGGAGERFCVRNSGLKAVVEAVGDHGCEYMTGGRVVVLGTTGRNFAAGMSGGIAYVLDEKGDFRKRCNLGMVLLERLEDDEEIKEVRNMIVKHAGYTNSSIAWKVLSHWDEMVPKFVKVMPEDYKRILSLNKNMKNSGITEDNTVMAIFQRNKSDKARIASN